MWAQTKQAINHTSTVSPVGYAGCEELVTRVDEWSAPWQSSELHWSTGQVGPHYSQQQHWGTAARGRVCHRPCSDVNTPPVASQRSSGRSWRDAGSTGSETSSHLCIACGLHQVVYISTCIICVHVSSQWQCSQSCLVAGAMSHHSYSAACSVHSN